MELYEYKNYKDYVKQQTIGNMQKLRSHSGVGPEVIAKIQEYIPSATNIICHGTRAGHEQRLFKEAYNPKFIIGTEISETATEFPYTLQWDFQKQKGEWIGKFDIVFSNSFDHSITPEETFKNWLDQLSPSGSLIMELHIAQPDWKPNKVDPLGYKRADIVRLVHSNGYRVTDEWLSPNFTNHRGKFGKYRAGRPTLRIQK